MTGEPSDYSVVGSSAVAAASIMGRGVRFGSVSSRTISQAVKVLAVSDPEAAEEARSAVGWIVGGEDVEDPAAVTLAGVQRFVWYELAVKWMIPDEDKPIIVDALARLLDLLDRPACAEVCRAPLTAKVLAAWARSDDEGRKAFAKAMKTSLVEPVDTDRFGWGSIFGMNESMARGTVEDALEEAIVSGRLVRGRHGWRAVQKAIVDAVLDDDHPGEPGQNWLTSILTERMSTWVEGSRRSKSLGTLRSQVANRLLAPVAMPVDAADGLEPLLWFCDELAGGIDLTQKHFLGQKFVRRAEVGGAGDGNRTRVLSLGS